MMILWLDPGKTTGWARFSSRDSLPWKWGQVRQEHVWPLLETWSLYKEDLHIGYESFKLRYGRYPDLSPVEVIGVIKEWARQKHIPISTQSPSEVMGFWTNERLKGMGLYQPGKPHAMDAMRHLLNHMYRTNVLEGSLLRGEPTDTGTL